MSSKRITFVLDSDQDAPLIERLAALARTGDMSDTIRAALQAHLSPKSDVNTILAELSRLRAEVMTAVRSVSAQPGGEDRLLAAALDEQLDCFFKET
jgi:hypothetical protein